MKTPWAVILCKFSDDASEPYPKSYYQNLFAANPSGSPWNVIRYFYDYSHGTLDLSGTQVFGWYQLTQSVEDYNGPGGGRASLIKWARDAATAHGVDLSPYFSVVVCCNLWADIGAVSGGVVIQGPDTPFTSGLAHEMGHVYGLQHSRLDGSDIDYQDQWDVMSFGNCFSASDPVFKKAGPGLNAANMRSQGWLDTSRVWHGTGDTNDELVTLRPLDRHDLPGYLALELYDGLLVEFRLRAGWDAAIPRSAVLVHRFVGGHSYVMIGNSGVVDLVAGDSFGEEPPDPATFLGSYRRVDIVSIDEPGQAAVVRVRSHQFHWNLPVEVAIDPMALLLSGKAYAIWSELHHPHEPRVADVVPAISAMSPQAREATLRRATVMARYGQTVRAAIEQVSQTAELGTLHITPAQRLG
jgi:hypothetical protein